MWGSGNQWEHNRRIVSQHILHGMNSKENSIEQSQTSTSWKELDSMSPSRVRSHLANLSLWKDRQKSFLLSLRDENQHLVLTQNIMNKWREGDDPDMVQIAKEEEQNVYDMFRKCVEEERQ